MPAEGTGREALGGEWPACMPYYVGPLPGQPGSAGPADCTAACAATLGEGGGCDGGVAGEESDDARFPEELRHEGLPTVDVDLSGFFFGPDGHDDVDRLFAHADCGEDGGADDPTEQASHRREACGDGLPAAECCLPFPPRTGHIDWTTSDPVTAHDRMPVFTTCC
mmetsp:Transcript_88490/g.235473  ORF Transcript_88490/g.235473 Transcript_88490/m.235473 type:complete len:166 (-) Transcript_88490:82-579(-)